jgi:hypothetical protein
MQVHRLLAGHADLDGDDDLPVWYDDVPKPWPAPTADGVEPGSNVPVPRAGGAASVAMGPIYADVSVGGRHYDINIEAAEAGQVHVEVLGAGADGQRVARLQGEVADTDPALTLTLLGRLFLAAAAQAASRARGRRMHQGRQGESWTDEESQLLSARYTSGVEIPELAAELGRSQRAIKLRLYHLRLAPFPVDDLPQLRTPAVPKPAPAYTMEDLRRTHTNSHKRWEPEDDARLLTRFAEGATVDDLMAEFGRNHGAITSRLGHLGAWTSPPQRP